MWETEKKVQIEERRRKAAESGYNGWYRAIKKKGVPGYLKKE